jgi:tRNA(fMet)-specific endonuclease VapC
MLDTDTCIAAIKRNPEVIKKLRGKNPGQVGISTVTMSELCFGVEASARPEQNREALWEFMLPLEIAHYDDTCASRYGSVRASLRKKGRPIGALDTMIAAHAVALDVTLVTHNTREFGEVEGLPLEDWLKG